ncbi:MAG: hypothetical protein ACI909_003814, partial [Planctomycetota bacterium]
LRASTKERISREVWVTTQSVGTSDSSPGINSERGNQRGVV